MKVIYLLLISILFFGFSELMPHNKNFKDSLKYEMDELNSFSKELKQLSKDMDSIENQTDKALYKLERAIIGKTEKI